ncbi:hypothetical protein B0H63DRAFT_522488 [Podospora didyma]|uniref:Uncharacterized protein n=1 Tax=Podospora didyma TaxID=330526 RepID=A0AAE0NPC5_9PEZI|nr:hypothetical protein B0H63DRAFT_522488 [Podospora didyma]
MPHSVLRHRPVLGNFQSLVLASPVFYQQYLLDRRALLGHALTATLGSLLLDAFAVHTSFSLYKPGRELTKDLIPLFMDNYTAMRTAPPDLVLQQCTEADLADASLEAGSLSVTEQRRLLRALYRFQLY